MFSPIGNVTAIKNSGVWPSRQGNRTGFLRILLDKLGWRKTKSRRTHFCTVGLMLYRPEFKLSPSDVNCDNHTSQLSSSCSAASPAVEIKPGSLGPRACVARGWCQPRCPQAFALLHAHSNLSYTSEKSTKCAFQFGIELFLH